MTLTRRRIGKQNTKHNAKVKQRDSGGSESESRGLVASQVLSASLIDAQDRWIVDCMEMEMEFGNGIYLHTEHFNTLSRIVCGSFNVPQGTNEHGSYLRDGTSG